jgi:hypothetical protein
MEKSLNNFMMKSNYLNNNYSNNKLKMINKGNNYKTVFKKIKKFKTYLLIKKTFHNRHFNSYFKSIQ